mgnify:CR=1 FL=1
MRFRFKTKYFLIFLLLLMVEIAIAIFLKEGFIRYTVGDFLVVILMYCFFKSVIKMKSHHMAIATLFIAYSIEFLQLANIIQFLGLQEYKSVELVLGNHFSVQDLIAYSLGVMFILFLDPANRSRFRT